MEIQNEETETKGAFFIEEGGKRQAEMVYSKAGAARIIIEHTEVQEALKGKNVGKQLVAAAVNHARKNNLKIIPLCPFTLSVFKRVKEYEDVWDK
jgi:predicted GNAT family acetyltransferase